MSWEQDRDRPCDKLEINEAVGKLLESFNYDSIVPQPTRYVLSSYIGHSFIYLLFYTI